MKPVWLWSIVVAMVIVGIIALTMTMTPAWEQVRFRTHAMEKHQLDAYMARLAIRACGEGILVWWCPARGVHPPGFIFICADSTGKRCAFMSISADGVEFTSFITSCDYAYSKINQCQEVQIEEN